MTAKKKIDGAKLIKMVKSGKLQQEIMKAFKLNPPRGKPRGIFTVRMKIYFQFAR